jgi:hypothetical protein
MEMAVTMVEARRRKQAGGVATGVKLSADQLAAKTSARV